MEESVPCYQSSTAYHCIMRSKEQELHILFENAYVPPSFLPISHHSMPEVATVLDAA